MSHLVIYCWGSCHRKIVTPGCVLIRPDDGETVENTITFAVFAYPTNPNDPPIDHVHFTMGWHGYWQVASTAYPSDKNARFYKSVIP